MSLSFMISRSSPSIRTSVPDHLPNSTRSPELDLERDSSPSSSRPPAPVAMISPSCRLLLDGVGHRLRLPSSSGQPRDARLQHGRAGTRRGLWFLPYSGPATIAEDRRWANRRTKSLLALSYIECQQAGPKVGPPSIVYKGQPPNARGSRGQSEWRPRKAKF